MKVQPTIGRRPRFVQSCITRRHRVLLSALVLSVLPGSAFAQVAAPASGTVEAITIRAASLEGNLVGDPAERSVSVYLPPGS